MNFMILFSGREGSSPIISQLGSHPEISVPIFEHFDRPNAIRSWPKKPPQDLIDIAYSTGQRPGSENSLGPPPASIGFKWRIWGEADAVMDIALKHDVTVFHLYRCNVLDYVASIYLTHHIVPSISALQEYGVTGPGHTQFIFMQLAEDQQQRFGEIIAQQRFEIPIDFVIAKASEIFTKKKKTDSIYLAAARQKGLRTINLAYEDYLADADAFLRRLCRQIAVDPDVKLQTTFKKVARDDLLKQVINLDEISHNPRVTEITTALMELFASGPGLGPW